ncbi:HD domain-containing protein [Candidatus Saccharibacteria bacterium]|nr:HD domain-containing protein [Candidatus Saccharibacteria bacterium]
MDPSEELVQYIADRIFPRYEKYYSHNMVHINNVIENMMMLADYYGLDKDMAYTTASYHDIGLNIDRENHEKESAKILRDDKRLKDYFTEPQIETMAIAIEDHRGSRKERPRNIYGECISDSDRDFDILLLAKRQLATSLKSYPGLATFDEHFNRCYDYICKRINQNGVFNLWTNNPVLVERRDKFQKEYLDKNFTRSIYKKEWDRISSDGTKEKIINYYEDY